MFSVSSLGTIQVCVIVWAMTDSHKGGIKNENVADSWEEAGDEVNMIFISLILNLLFKSNFGSMVSAFITTTLIFFHLKSLRLLDLFKVFYIS